MTAMINAILTLLLFAGLWWILFGRYGKYHAERFEQEIVEIRRKMYNWARHHKIPLDYSAYKMLRHTMLGMSRTGVRASLLSFIWNRDKRPVTFSRRLDEAFGSLDENGRARLLLYREEMNLAAFKYLMLSPFIVVTVIPPLLAWVLIKYRHPTFLGFLEPAFDRFNDVALAKGMELENIGSESSWRSIATALGSPSA